MISWRRAIRRALVSGSSASILSTAALMVRGQRDCASVFAPVNAISHWLWKGRAIRQDGPSPRYTLVGYGIHHAMSILWAITYERLAARYRRPARQQGALEPALPMRKHEAGPTVVMFRRPGEADGSARAEDAAAGHGGSEGGREAHGRPGRGPVSRNVPIVPVMATAAVVAAGACLVDLRCTPQRLTPGFERRLTPSSLFLVYTAFDLGLVLCDSVSAFRRRKDRLPY